MERGEWIDPAFSSISFAKWSEMWLEAKTNVSAQTKRNHWTVVPLYIGLLPERESRSMTKWW